MNAQNLCNVYRKFIYNQKLLVVTKIQFCPFAGAAEKKKKKRILCLKMVVKLLIVAIANLGLRRHLLILLTAKSVPDTYIMLAYYI